MKAMVKYFWPVAFATPTNDVVPNQDSSYGAKTRLGKLPLPPGVFVGAGVLVRVAVGTTEVLVGVGLGPTVGVLVGGAGVLVYVGVFVGAGVLVGPPPV